MATTLEETICSGEVGVVVQRANAELTVVIVPHRPETVVGFEEQIVRTTRCNRGNAAGTICSGRLVLMNEPSPSWPEEFLPIAQRLPSDLRNRL